MKNRIIQFRAWLTDEYPVEAHRNHMLPMDELDLNGCLDGHNAGNVVLMQYTGMKDANGMDVYEGDVLRSEDSVCLVVGFRHGAFWLTVIGNPNVSYPLHFLKDAPELPRPLVVGNIYQNPEFFYDH